MIVDRPWFCLLALAATFVTTLGAGAMQLGVIPWETPEEILRGLPFALSLLAILGAHEYGHYAAAKRHGVLVSPPLFIPAPTLIGTFGAFIRMRSPVLDRRMLFDIGIAGPVAGFAVTLPILAAGVFLSEVRVGTGAGGLELGSPLLMTVLVWVFHGVTPETVDILLHPVAFAGWIGLLVTALNLIPASQLDGGHIAYAVVGRFHRRISLAVIVILILLGFLGWVGWLIWAAVLAWLGVKHPPVLYEGVLLDGRRKALALLAFAMLLLTFTPSPA